MQAFVHQQYNHGSRAEIQIAHQNKSYLVPLKNFWALKTTAPVFKTHIPLAPIFLTKFLKETIFRLQIGPKWRSL